MTWTLVLYTLTVGSNPVFTLQGNIPGFTSKAACISARDALQGDYMEDGNKVEKLYPHVYREWPRLGGVCIRMAVER